ncbi:PspC domain-containing protein [Clostridium sp.]|uniref:PspC domain-containing protein n=1 Tax=Clostridium sp. TaxID=1506 RepID=UPI003F34E647
MEKSFFKNSKNQKLFGVCSGLSEYWNVDVTLVRLALLLLAVFTRSTFIIIAYAALAFILPDKYEATDNYNQQSNSNTKEYKDVDFIKVDK